MTHSVTITIGFGSHPIAMPSPPRLLSLSLFNHHTDRHYEALSHEKVLERARRLARIAHEKGLRALKLSTDPLVEITMETDERGRVTKNSLGVLDLSWQAAQHPEWPEMIYKEIDDIRAAIHKTHREPLQNLIWAGMGGSAEDKAMYQALGLLSGGVRVYILDSTDPAKLQAILDSIGRRSGKLSQALKRTLVLGMAMGMTSYEPVINLEKLHLLFKKYKIPSASNFLYMTLPGSLLDQFAGPRGYRRVDLQPDGDNTTAGRHSGPLTRGSLYPLGFNDVNLEEWMSSAVLTEDEIQDAFWMAAFLHGNGLESRDKVTLWLPAQWAGSGIWSKQDFEESLGKSEKLGIKIFPQQTLEPGPVRGVRDPRQDRVFWAVNVAGCDNPDAAAVKALREEGHPVAVLDLNGPMPLPKYMQWLHYVVFGIGCLRRMNFVTQPSVELYKQITGRLYNEARKAGGVERTKEWRALAQTRNKATAPGGIIVHYDSLIRAGLWKPEAPGPLRAGAAEVLAKALASLYEQGKIEYAELTFYGDMRYRREGPHLLALLQEAAATTFAARLGMSTDIHEGPAMNHSYHEMIIGHGRCFSIVMLTRRHAAIESLRYQADYHKAQWLATKLALEQRGRAVVALTFPDLGPRSLRSLRAFFEQVARHLSTQ